jgi:HlyD family secretion protein
MASPMLDYRSIAAGGLVEPVSEARELAATVVGRLVKMSVEEGDAVAAGDVIAQVENDDLKAQLEAGVADAIARENELARLKAGARPQEISAARAQLREAEAVAAMARSASQRQASLAAKQATSKEAVERADADRDTAEARRDLAAQKLSLLVAPPRSEDVGIAESNLNAARARLAEINAQIEKTLVRSPIDGVILKLYRRAGETVTNLPPTPVAVVGDISRLRVRADVDESDVAQIDLHQIVWITADAFPGKRFRGTVAQIAFQLGRKNFRNNNPEERLDTKILEVLIDLEPNARLPIGLPVDIKTDIKTDAARETQTLSDAREPVRRNAEPVFRSSILLDSSMIH